MSTNQPQSPPPPILPPVRPSFFGRILDDFRSGRRYVSALSKAKGLAARKQAVEQQLLACFGEIGAKAVEHGLGREMAAFQDAVGLRGRLADAEGTLTDRSAARRQAEDALAQEAQRHFQVISSLDAEHKPLAEAASRAAQELSAVQQETASLEGQAKKTEAEIAAPGPGQPATVSPQELRQKLAALQESVEAAQARLPELQDTAVRSKAVADKKAKEVAEANQAWWQAKSKCEAELASAKSADTESMKTVEATRSSLKAALQAFGKAVFEAGIKSPVLEASVSLAQPLLAEIGDTSAKITDQQKEAASSKGGATRAVIYVGGSLLVVLGLVLIFKLIGATHEFMSQMVAVGPLSNSTGSDKGRSSESTAEDSGSARNSSESAIGHRGTSIAASDLKGLSLEQITEKFGRPTLTYSCRGRPNMQLWGWKVGDDVYVAVSILATVDMAHYNILAVHDGMSRAEFGTLTSKMQDAIDRARSGG
jgi:hypothetical protein